MVDLDEFEGEYRWYRVYCGHSICFRFATLRQIIYNTQYARLSGILGFHVRTASSADNHELRRTNFMRYTDKFEVPAEFMQ